MGGPPAVPLIAMPAWARAPEPPRQPGHPFYPLSMEQVTALFDGLAAQPHIPFRYAKEYCYARAHEMRRLIVEQGMECGKVFNLATLEGQEVNDIRVEHPDFGTIVWVYHVAPTVFVRTADDRIVRMVIDPSLFDGPATVEQWLARQDCARSEVHHLAGDVYQPMDERDDDYSETREDLEKARIRADHWERSRTGEATWRDGMVPDDQDEEEGG